MCVRGKLIRPDGTWVPYVGTFAGMVPAGEQIGANRLVGRIGPRGRAVRPEEARHRRIRPESAPDPDEAA
jgi:hypothetical protein